MNSIRYASIVGSLMYVMVCIRLGIVYGGAKGDDSKVKVERFVESDYAGCINTRKSLSIYVFICLVQQSL